MRTEIKLLLFFVLGIPSLLVTLFFAINSVDEKPLPEVVKLLDWQVPPHGLDDGNGYLILRGLEAPAGQDAAQFGRALIAEEVTQFRAKASFQPVPANEDRGPGIARLRALHCNYPEESNCLDFYLAQDHARVRSQMEEALAAQPQLLERYHAIVVSPNFIDVLPPRADAVFPPYFYVTAVSEYERVRAIDAIAAGKLDEGLDVFVKNALFSRRLLADSSVLISHMVALAMVQTDMRLLSELLERYPQLADRAEALAPLLTPIDGGKYSIDHTMDYETAFNLNTIALEQEIHRRRAGEDDDGSVFGRNTGFVDQTNASLNLLFRLMTLRREVMTSPAATFDKARADYQVKRDRELGLGVGIFYFYNPSGKILAGLGENQYEKYAERQFDVDAWIRLVALQAKLIAGHVPQARVADAVAHADAAMRNPYSGQPMKWDPAKNTLSFTGRQSSSMLPGKSKTFRAHLAF